MPVGKGRRPAPKGYLTAARTGELLGSSRMYKLIEADRLHRYTPPGQKHGYYSELEVNTIIEQDKSFYEERLHKLPARFVQARVSDVQSLYELAVKIFGSSTISIEKRTAWIEQEPRGNYVLRRPDIHEVIGYLYVQALSHERIVTYLEECRGSTITPDELLPIRAGQPLELILAGVGTDRRADKQYAGVLLRGFARELEQWAREGIEISKIFAYSETIDGIYLSFSMGMQLWKRPRYLEGEGPFFTFVLDVEKSTIPLLRPYKRALAEYKRLHTTSTTSRPAPRARTTNTTHVVTSRPEGTITLAELATLLDRSTGTLKGHFKKWDEEPEKYAELEHIKIEIDSTGTYNHYFTPEQVERIRAYIERVTRGKK